MKAELLRCSVCPAVIQLMAAARAKRGLAFFTFKDEALECGLKRSYTLLRMKGATVGECSAQRLPTSSRVSSDHELTPSQRTSTASWWTTAMPSKRLTPPAWNCLTSSNTATFVQNDLPRVCSEQQQQACSLFSDLRLAPLTHADCLTV